MWIARHRSIMPCIQTLPEGCLDIIGDIHGQYAALQALLRHLGYDEDGTHPQGRYLILLGDLVDRGADVPAVLDWYRRLHARGRVQTVLGNHEINLLLNDAKDGSGWFFDRRAARDARIYASWQRYPTARKAALVAFLNTQPLVLQRADLRIVHAAWDADAVAHLQTTAADNIISLHRHWETALDDGARAQPWYQDWRAEEDLAGDLGDPQQAPAFRPATAARDVYYSRGNPVRVLTCGAEVPSAAPFYAGGRWRFVERQAWWDDYRDDTAVVIGHYWRRWRGDTNPLFPFPPHHWHGARRNVFCCDFAVGARWRDRATGTAPEQSPYRLAALRWPERTLLFDNGEAVATVA